MIVSMSITRFHAFYFVANLTFFQKLSRMRCVEPKEKKFEMENIECQINSRRDLSTVLTFLVLLSSHA